MACGYYGRSSPPSLSWWWASALPLQKGESRPCQLFLNWLGLSPIRQTGELTIELGRRRDACEWYYFYLMVYLCGMADNCTKLLAKHSSPGRPTSLPKYEVPTSMWWLTSHDRMIVAGLAAWLVLGACNDNRMDAPPFDSQSRGTYLTTQWSTEKVERTW